MSGVIMATKYMPTKHYNAGDVIFREGDLADGVYLICDGTVKIVKNEDGKETVFTTMGEDAIFGEMAVIDGGTRSASAIAETDVWCYVFNTVGFEKKLAELDPFMRGMFRVLVGTIREMNKRLK